MLSWGSLLLCRGERGNNFFLKNVCFAEGHEESESTHTTPTTAWAPRCASVGVSRCVLAIARPCFCRETEVGAMFERKQLILFRECGTRYQRECAQLLRLSLVRFEGTQASARSVRHGRARFCLSGPRARTVSLAWGVRERQPDVKDVARCCHVMLPLCFRA